MTIPRTAIIIFIIGCLQMSLLAQPGQGRRIGERMGAIESRRVAHITKSLSLTPAEARLFWPVYNEYLDKLEALSRKHRNWNEQVYAIDKLTDEEAELIAEREISRLEESAVLRRTYHEKLKEVLPIRKIAMLYESEREFNRALFRESQYRMRGRP
jgi:hypothetical protein